MGKAAHPVRHGTRDALMVIHCHPSGFGDGLPHQQYGEVDTNGNTTVLVNLVEQLRFATGVELVVDKITDEHGKTRYKRPE